MRACLLSISVPEYANLNELASKVARRSPFRSLDDKKMPTNGLFAYIAALKEFQFENSDPKKSVVQADFQLHHCFLSFAIEGLAHEIDYVVNIDNLNVTRIRVRAEFGHVQRDSLIISGTLAQWQYVLPKLLRNDERDFEVNVRRAAFSPIYV